MPEKKPWTQQEDRLIRQMFEVKKITKWSTIAQKLAEEYHMPGRNGKQCRQRYQTQLCPTFVHKQWTLQEQNLMYKLHDEIGNKWAVIAQKMPGRTDNCVKNHFYSNLRKSIRKLNKCISQNFKPHIKQIRPIVLYKIIQATDAYFKLDVITRSQLPFDCGKIKNRLLLLADDKFDMEADLQHMKQLANMIHNFSRDYKRKPKKDRRGVAQSLNLKGPPKIQKDKFKFDDDLEDYDPDERPASEGQANDHMLGQLQSQDSEIYGEKQEDSLRQTPGSHKKMQVIQVSGNHTLRLSKHEQTQNKGIEMRLQSAGILNSSMTVPQNQTNSIHLIPIQFPFFNSNTTTSIYIPFFKQSIDMSMSMSMQMQMQGSLNSQHKQRQREHYNRERIGFNLGESVDKLKYSFLMRQSAEVDEQSKLFKST